MPNEQEQLRMVMRQWASGICIVSTSHNNVNHGMTVSSFSSVSIEPQLVTISLMKNSRTHDFVVDAKIFGITILSEAQKEISTIFAGMVPETENRFTGIDIWTLATGSPLLKDGLAFLDRFQVDYLGPTQHTGDSAEANHGEGLGGIFGERATPTGRHHHDVDIIISQSA